MNILKLGKTRHGIYNHFHMEMKKILFSKTKARIDLIDLKYLKMDFLEIDMGKFGNWSGKYFVPKYLWGGYRKSHLIREYISRLG